MITMRFDFRDLFQTNRLALSFQRLWIQFLGLLFGYGAYVVLTYAGLLLAGQHLDVLWPRYGLLPCAFGFSAPWYSTILFGVALFIAVFAWMISGTAVSRAVYMNMKGNVFYTWKEAFRFALKNKSGSVIFTPLTIAIIAVLTGAGGFVVGWLSKITSYVGDFGISLFVIVWFMATLFIVFVLLALVVSLFLTPSVLATTDDDAFEGIFQSFSILWSQPIRFIIYEIVIFIFAILGFGILAFIAKRTWLLMTSILTLGMGSEYADLSYYASYLLQNWIYPAVAWSKVLFQSITSQLFFTRDFVFVSVPGHIHIAAHLFAVSLVVIGGFIFSYPLAIFHTGNTISFLILKKIKDDDNLLERKDREEDDEEEMEEMSTAEPPKEVKKAPAKKKPAPKKTAAKKKATPAKKTKTTKK